MDAALGSLEVAFFLGLVPPVAAAAEAEADAEMGLETLSEDPEDLVCCPPMTKLTKAAKTTLKTIFRRKVERVL